MASAENNNFYRFSPSDQDLIKFLRNKLSGGNEYPSSFIKDEDIYKHEPWNFAKAGESSCPLFFFSPRYPKSSNTSSTKVNKKARRRVTGDKGVWDCHGTIIKIYDSDSALVGEKVQFTYKTLPEKVSSGWIMYEYRVCSTDSSQEVVKFNDLVLCRIHMKKDAQANKRRHIVIDEAADRSTAKRQRRDDQAEFDEKRQCWSQAADHNQVPSSSSSSQEYEISFLRSQLENEKMHRVQLQEENITLKQRVEQLLRERDYMMFSGTATMSYGENGIATISDNFYQQLLPAAEEQILPPFPDDFLSDLDLLLDLDPAQLAPPTLFD